MAIYICIIRSHAGIGWEGEGGIVIKNIHNNYYTTKNFKRILGQTFVDWIQVGRVEGVRLLKLQTLEILNKFLPFGSTGGRGCVTLELIRVFHLRFRNNILNFM